MPQPSKVEWLQDNLGKPGYTWNPIKGLCPRACNYCYVPPIYKRFKLDVTVRLDMTELEAIQRIPNYKKVFVGSTIDMYHKNITDDWLRPILDIADTRHKNVFYTLTHYPQRYAELPIPHNWMLGTTINVGERNDNVLREVKPAHFKFISFEPLFGNPKRIELTGIDWIIIGACTGPKRKMYVTKKEWVERLVDKAMKLKIPVFMKNNLADVWGQELLQEFDNERF